MNSTQIISKKPSIHRKVNKSIENMAVEYFGNSVAEKSAANYFRTILHGIPNVMRGKTAS